MSSMRFTLLVLSLLFFFSCKNASTSDGTQDFHLPNASAIVEAVNAERPDWDQFEKTEGPVDIRVDDNKIVLTHDAYNSSAIVTYYLFTEEKAKKIKTGRIDIAEVIYLEQSLIVNSITDKNTLFFTVNTHPSPDYLDEMDGVRKFMGHGLSERKVKKGMQSSSAFYCGCAPAGYPEGACLYSNALSIDCHAYNEHGSCRVYCTGQYYGCCGKRSE